MGWVVVQDVAETGTPTVYEVAVDVRGVIYRLHVDVTWPDRESSLDWHVMGAWRLRDGKVHSQVHAVTYFERGEVENAIAAALADYRESELERIGQDLAEDEWEARYG